MSLPREHQAARPRRMFGVVLVVATLAGCASGPGALPLMPRGEDPWQPFEACHGNFSDGRPVPCQSKNVRIEPLLSLRGSWSPTNTGDQGRWDGFEFYRSSDPAQFHDVAFRF